MGHQSWEPAGAMAGWCGPVGSGAVNRPQGVSSGSNRWCAGATPGAASGGQVPGELLGVGSSEAQGWSESGSVPLSVGSHGTPVSIGPLMPPS
jgi:hypothetical protein